MPNTREKLIELLRDVQYLGGLEEKIADHLIANGVIIKSDCEDCASATTRVIDKLQGEIAKRRWIPVTERLPEKDGRYLVLKNLYGTIRYDVIYFAKDGRKVDKYDFGREWKNVWYQYSSEWGYVTTDNVTHWMPLPQPPKGE